LSLSVEPVEKFQRWETEGNGRHTRTRPRSAGFSKAFSVPIDESWNRAAPAREVFAGIDQDGRSGCVKGARPGLLRAVEMSALVPDFPPVFAAALFGFPASD